MRPRSSYNFFIRINWQCVSNISDISILQFVLCMFWGFFSSFFFSFLLFLFFHPLQMTHNLRFGVDFGSKKCVFLQMTGGIHLNHFFFFFAFRSFARSAKTTANQNTFIHRTFYETTWSGSSVHVYVNTNVTFAVHLATRPILGATVHTHSLHLQPDPYTDAKSVMDLLDKRVSSDFFLRYCFIFYFNFIIFILLSIAIQSIHLKICKNCMQI